MTGPERPILADECLECFENTTAFILRRATVRATFGTRVLVIDGDTERTLHHIVVTGSGTIKLVLTPPTQEDTDARPASNPD
mgnify:CR=1 FL=1